MDISVVIPALNEAQLLPRLLGDLRGQAFPAHEVIVADAGSTDGTSEVAREHGAQVVVGGMPGIGRNNGAEVARGAFLYFLDADVRLPPTFLADAHAEIEERFLDLATCEIIPISDNPADKLLHDFANLAVKIGQFSEPHAPGCCIMISRRLFRRVGGFDESLKLAEDHDLVKRASQFRPLRVLRSTHVTVSVRRLEKEGRVNLVNKYLAVELHRAFFGEVRNELVDYEFGHYADAESVPAADRIQESQRLLDRIYQSYTALIAGFGAGPGAAAVPPERLATVREQFESLKGQLRSLLTFRERPSLEDANHRNDR